MKNLKLKGLKYNKGKYNLFEDRFVFFPPKLINVLSSIYGEGVKSLLVWLGKKAGWTLIQNWESELDPKDLEDLVDKFIEIINHQGWGHFNASEVSKDLIIIELRNNVASSLDNSSKYICYFINGLLAGFGEYALYKVKTTETKCCFEESDSDFCEFQIKKIE
jgi:predicted hydrocarbon binding protein